MKRRRGFRVILILACAAILLLLLAVQFLGGRRRQPGGMDKETWKLGWQAADLAEKAGGTVTEETLRELEEIEKKLGEVELEEGSDAFMANLVVQMKLKDLEKAAGSVLLGLDGGTGQGDYQKALDDLTEALKG